MNRREKYDYPCANCGRRPDCKQPIEFWPVLSEAVCWDCSLKLYGAPWVRSVWAVLLFGP